MPWDLEGPTGWVVRTLGLQVTETQLKGGRQDRNVLKRQKGQLITAAQCSPFSYLQLSSWQTALGVLGLSPKQSKENILPFLLAQKIPGKGSDWSGGHLPTLSPIAGVRDTLPGRGALSEPSAHPGTTEQL
jgi:hypothetical protein